MTILPTAFLLLLLLLVSMFWRPDLNPSSVEAAELGPHGRFLELPNGQRVHYQLDGPVNAPVVMLLHGFMASLHDWDAVSDGLSQRFRVLRIDMPGMGLTGWSNAMELGEHAVAKTLEQILDALGIDAVHLVGHSRGGYAAWVQAVLYPSRVKSLVLIASAGFPQDHEPRFSPLSFKIAQYRMGKAILRWSGSKFLVRKTLESLVADKRMVSKPWVERAYRLSLRKGNRKTMLALRPFQPNEELLDQLSSIEIPTLLIWGINDFLIPIRHAHLFSTKLKTSHIFPVPDAGHYPPMECPGLVSNAITLHVQDALRRR